MSDEPAYRPPHRPPKRNAREPDHGRGGPTPIGHQAPPPGWDRTPRSAFTLERVFLVLAVVVFAVQGLVFLTTTLAFMPYGLLALPVAAFVLYVVYRVVRDHYGSAEDRYYEENFDR